MMRYELHLTMRDGQKYVLRYAGVMRTSIVIVRSIMEGVLDEHKHAYYGYRYEDDDFAEKVPYFERMGNNGRWYLYIHMDDVDKIEYKIVGEVL